MRISTCMKKFALAALTVALLTPTTYAEVGTLAGPANYAVKAKKGQKVPAKGKKLTP